MDKKQLVTALHMARTLGLKRLVVLVVVEGPGPGVLCRGIDGPGRWYVVRAGSRLSEGKR